MAVEVLETPVGLLGGLVSLTRWLEAIGVILVVWVILTIVSFFINRKKLQNIVEVKEDVKIMKRKIDKIEKLLENKKR